MNLLHLAQPGKPALIIDCGTADFFFEVNERLHKELLYRNIPHDYITRPGSHNWDYWKNAVRYQLLYFYDYFNRVYSRN
jgi:S-formylglutathione hydrolase FrmB